MASIVVPPFSPKSTVFSALARHARATPRKLAVISANRRLNYEQLANQVSCVAAALHSRGVGPGHRVVVETDDNITHLIGMIGAMTVGAIAVALPTDRQSYRAVCDDAEPTLILGAAPVVTASDPAHYPRIDVAAIVETAGKFDWDIFNRVAQSNEIAMLYYTSGTSSGIRKGVMQSYGQLHNTVHYITDTMQLNSSVVEFVASPPDNAFWFGRCRCVVHAGGTLLLSNGPLNPFGIISSMNRHAGNALSGDTPIFMLLLHHLDKHLLRLAPQIRWVKIASAPMPLADKLKMMEALPKARIVFNYGLTEAMRTCLNVLKEHPQKLASVGRPSPSVNLLIADGDGNVVQNGTVGEVLIGGGNLASGYWKRDDLWASRFSNGWYRSGDLGYLDGDGFLYLQGRIDDAINSGGKTIALSEVENYLRPFFRNTSFAACGMIDPKGVLGDVVVIAIEGAWKEPIAWNELRIHLFEAMDTLMVPTTAYVVPKFPRTSNQKIQLTLLRKAIEDGSYPAL